MKKISAFLAASVAATSIASAQDELSISATFAWESAYVFRGAQLAEETFMPAIDLSYGNFYAGIWAALPADGAYATEVDVYAGYAMPVSDLMSLDMGFTYYTYPSLEDDFFDSDTNTFEIFAGLAFDVTLAPSLYVYYDFDLEQLTVEGAIGHSFEVSEAASVDLSAYLGWWDADGGADNTYAGIGVAYAYSFTDSASLSVGVNYGWSDEKGLGKNGNKSDKLYYGFSFTAGF